MRKGTNLSASTCARSATGDVPLALLFFNGGGEVGQLMFIAGALTVIAITRRLAIAAPAWAWRVPPYAIGAVASCWLIQRLTGVPG